MKPLRLGIDIDGTVTSPESLLPHINKRFNSAFVLDDITAYSLTESFPMLDAEEFNAWYKEAEAEIYRTSPAHAYAREILSAWNEVHELFYISARGLEVKDVTFGWFGEHGIPYHHIELTGSHRKIEAARRLGVDVFFEDKHDNAVDIHEEVGIPVLLFDAPYNRMPIPDGVIRIHDWREADAWLKSEYATEKA
ncbi:hypothetical protein [Edaphobacillus lindanitolerans]|uniref:Nucleotidase n=1 Tax=Edaphobacillus lindanitolerans TaxID=550447 RepID=A0A1U7PPI5_9BACI|nr:hypothetical protein [Edaphobacillus lindanitolerans]SIT82132.1 hypothetical protein SAMN05428946_1474 [Edaphobacillus lindanitolerans]